MNQCSNCGNTYNKEFQACPHCGSAGTPVSQNKEQEASSNIAGILITIAVFGLLLGAIGYGGYIVYTMATREPEEVMEFNETTTTTTTTGTYVTRSTTTTAKLEYNEVSANGNTYMIPNGYGVVEKPANATVPYIDMCIVNLSDYNEYYCISIVQGNVLPTALDDLKLQCEQLGFTYVDNTRLYGRMYHYFKENNSPTPGYTTGITYSNKGEKVVMISFSIKGNNLSEENGFVLSQIMSKSK